MEREVVLKRHRWGIDILVHTFTTTSEISAAEVFSPRSATRTELPTHSARQSVELPPADETSEVTDRLTSSAERQSDECNKGILGTESEDHVCVILSSNVDSMRNISMPPISSAAFGSKENLPSSRANSAAGSTKSDDPKVAANQKGVVPDSELDDRTSQIVLRAREIKSNNSDLEWFERRLEEYFDRREHRLMADLESRLRLQKVDLDRYECQLKELIIKLQKDSQTLSVSH